MQWSSTNGTQAATNWQLVLLKSRPIRWRRIQGFLGTGLVEDEGQRTGLADGGAGKFVGENFASRFLAQIFENSGVVLGPLTPKVQVIFPELLVTFAIDWGLSFAKLPVVAVDAVALDVQLVGLLDGAAIL